jgi:hypothetical protein
MDHFNNTRAQSRKIRIAKYTRFVVARQSCFNHGNSSPVGSATMVIIRNLFVTAVLLVVTALSGAVMSAEAQTPETAAPIGAPATRPPATPSQTPAAASTPQTPAADPKDVATMDAIVAALYDVISGPAGQKRNWDRFRSLFYPGARLIPTGRRPTGETVARVGTAEDYITRSAPLLEQNGFFEREISRRTEKFGNIAHLFSTYESRHKADDEKPFARGINSIQLWNDGKRWWVLTVMWQGEDDKTPLPAEYLRTRN